MGVATDRKFTIDPEAFTLVDGELYLNRNTDLRKKWREDQSENIKKGEEKWPDVKKLDMDESVVF